MTTKRIIGKIDIKGNKVIKGIRFEGLKIIGDLEKFLNERESDFLVDEIYINNITGSLYDTHLDLNLLEKICKNIHIPVTVQGGINSLKEIENLFNKGASRVALNNSIVKDLIPLETLFKEFGSQAIVFSPSIRVNSEGKIEFFTNAGREIVKLKENLDTFNYLCQLRDKGLIEILLRFIDYDGVNANINDITIKQIKKISEINIDTIVSGSMHLEKNFINALNFGAQGIALSYTYIYEYERINNIRSKISQSWEVRK